MIRIALPNKGRLAELSRALLSEAGMPLTVAGDRSLRASVGTELEALFVRAADIPEFVADGAADCGITGWDLVAESGRPLCSRLDLQFGECELVVAVRDESPVSDCESLPAGTRVATPFPRLTATHFERLGIGVEVVPVSGAAEVAPHLGIADVVVDLTSSGSTLRTNGLRRLATVLESSARLVIPMTPAPERGTGLEELAGALESVVAARGSRYVMANVPRAALGRIREVLPGLRGPTVVDVLNSGAHVAVHAVVPAPAIRRAIADLRALGGEGILVTRIERLMP
jgi:ATP phosphoribosyltransferase